MINDEDLDRATMNLYQTTEALCTIGKTILESPLQPALLRAYVDLLNDMEDAPNQIRFALIQARGFLAYFSVMEQAEAALTAKKAAAQGAKRSNNGDATEAE